MVKLELSLKRVQTFIFEVPRLKAMLGANALVGQVMRDELPKLALNKAVKLKWPEAIAKLGNLPQDPLADADNPAKLYNQGILARDGGHFIAVFEDKAAAQGFLEEAEQTLAEKLPGVLFEATLADFEPVAASNNTQHEAREIKARETHLLDLPVLQVCEETGSEPASTKGKNGWQAQSVSHRQNWGETFYEGRTKDIIGLLRQSKGIYPDAMGWKIPRDLADIAAGGYLALIHADGNGIGKRYNQWREGTKSKPAIYQEAHGETFFHSMRVVVRRAVVDALHSTFTNPGGLCPYQLLMLGGDDLLLICRSDLALPFAKNYAEELQKYTLADGKPLDVAIGIAIAQKNYPLHRLHELAESLASSAKRLHRSLGGEQTSVIDWQVVTQSWFEGVKEARQKSEHIEYTAHQNQVESLLLTCRPYRVLGEDGLQGLLEAACQLDSADEEQNKSARSPLRSLRDASEKGRLSGEMAFDRLPDKVKKRLGWPQDHKLWQKQEVAGKTYYLTRALDIVGIREIKRLGRSKP